MGNIKLKWEVSVKRWSWAGLLVIALATAGACSLEEFKGETDFILEQAGTQAGAIEFEGEVLVYAEDVPGLFVEISSVDTLSERRDVVAAYLTRQERVDCILEDIEQAVEDEQKISCKGDVLVEEEDVPGLQDEISARGSEPAQRAFLGSHVYQWGETKRVDVLLDSLSQKENVKGIPLLGTVLDSIHRFPIMHEGEVLASREDVSRLLAQFSVLSTEKAKRDLVEDFLNLK